MNFKSLRQVTKRSCRPCYKNRTFLQTRRRAKDRGCHARRSWPLEPREWHELPQRRMHWGCCALLATSIALGCGGQSPSENQAGGAAGGTPMSEGGAPINAGSSSAGSNPANGGTSGTLIVVGGAGGSAHAGSAHAGSGAVAAGADGASAGSSGNGEGGSVSAGFGGGGRAGSGGAGGIGQLGLAHNPV